MHFFLYKNTAITSVERNSSRLRAWRADGGLQAGSQRPLGGLAVSVCAIVRSGQQRSGVAALPLTRTLVGDRIVVLDVGMTATWFRTLPWPFGRRYLIMLVAQTLYLEREGRSDRVGCNCVPVFDTPMLSKDGTRVQLTL
jgi:hypothetical protein